MNALHDSLSSTLPPPPAALRTDLEPLVTTVTATYRRLNALYFGRAEIARAGLLPGKVSMLIEGQPGFSALGTLNPSGGLSGMARTYNALNLRVGDTVECVVTGPSQLLVTATRRTVSTPSADDTPEPAADAALKPATESVFLRQRLRPIHIDLFSPENLNRWEPENEPDVYMAFGVLQEYTRFRYCCATSRELLDRLGFQAATKPDAILVNDNTGEYVVAEFKMRSSSFKLNHQPSDVDVLVVWFDDEPDKTKLPPDVLCLRDIAREAAQETINGR